MGRDDSFLQQVPPGLVLLFLGFLLLFLISLALLLVKPGAKGSKPKRRSATTDSVASVGLPAVSATGGSDDILPDLDLLLSDAAPSPTGSAPREMAPPAPDTGSARLDGNAGAGATAIMTVLRGADGQLLVDLDGAVYGPGQAITDADARKRFAVTVRELVKFAAEMAATPAAGPVAPSAAPSAPAEQPVPPAPTPTPPPRPEAKSNRGASTPSILAGEVPGDLPRFSQLASEPLKLRGGKPKEPVPEINIGSSVEAYLQYRLQQTPEFAGRSIHISTTNSGGVIIQVDGRYFEAVRDVDDEAVRDFLIATIEEWQARQ